MENPANRAETAMTVLLPVELAVQLEQYLHRTGQTGSHVMVAALSAYLQAEAHHRAAIEQGIVAAERQEFAPDTEVHAFFTRYGA